MKTKLLATLLLVFATSLAAAETVDMTKRTAELQNQRFGMFICWSFSTFSGKEWTPGVTNINFFRATECDTEQWARTAKISIPPTSRLIVLSQGYRWKN